MCGGGDQRLIFRKKAEIFSDCEKLGSKSGNIKMREKRLMSGSILITKKNGAEQKLWVTGGYNVYTGSNNKKLSKTSEYVSTVKTLASQGPDLPLKLGSHCMAHVNQSTIVILGGSGDKPLAGFSWIFVDIDNKVLSQELKLSRERSGHSCGQVSVGGQKVVVMAGGGRNSTELMIPNQDGSFTWKDGPDLPHFVTDGPSVSLSNGNFLLVGGAIHMLRSLHYIMQLSCPTEEIQDCLWTKLDQELFVGRGSHLAMMVPRNFVPCI